MAISIYFIYHFPSVQWPDQLWSCFCTCQLYYSKQSDKHILHFHSFLSSPNKIKARYDADVTKNITNISKLNTVGGSHLYRHGLILKQRICLITPLQRSVDTRYCFPPLHFTLSSQLPAPPPLPFLPTHTTPQRNLMQHQDQ